MLTRDGLDLHYEVTGSGPALLLPKFNYFRWDRYLDVGLLAGRFTVVVASPRGFMASSRSSPPLPSRSGDSRCSVTRSPALSRRGSRT